MTKHQLSLRYVTAAISTLCLSITFISQTLASELPLFDAHIHYSEDIWNAIPPANAIKRLKENGIRRAIVSATPAKGAIKLYKQDTELVVPFLRPYRTPDDRRDWYTNPKILEYVRSNLEEFDYRGLGEFHLFGSQVDTPVMKGILELAKKKKLILLAHSNHETIDALVAAAPGLTIIWAHGGFDVDIDVITSKLEKYKNLYIELSFREGITENNRLTPQWRKAFTTYPTRFLTGSDTYIGPRWLQLPELTGAYRGWLNQLPSDVAEAIAFKNGERIFER